MSTLVTKKEIIAYLIASIFLLIFGIIYECFSHEVYSYYMIFAFTIPLIGLIFSSAFKCFKLNTNGRGRTILGLSIETFSFWMVINGILEIYGTTNYLVNIFPIIGIVLLLAGLILLIHD